MSIAEMIKSHPDVAGDLNEQLALAIRHAMFCATICTSCADACVAEEKVAEMRQCIRFCLDCADVCAATTSVATRRTGQNVTVIRAMLEVCIKACEACAQECEKHDNAHCRRCATMCRECASDCAKALPSVT